MTHTHTKKQLLVKLSKDGALRFEIPPKDKIPNGTFPGIDEYIQLMNECLEPTPQQRPESFRKIMDRLKYVFVYLFYVFIYVFMFLFIFIFMFLFVFIYVISMFLYLFMITACAGRGYCKYDTMCVWYCTECVCLCVACHGE